MRREIRRLKKEKVHTRSKERPDIDLLSS